MIITVAGFADRGKELLIPVRRGPFGDVIRNYTLALGSSFFLVDIES